MRKALAAAMCGWAILAAAGPGGAETYHVDGNDERSADTNGGTSEQPFRTLPAAAARAGPGDTVVIRGGTYRGTFSLAAVGEPNRPITIQAAPGHRVVLSGADRITGWKPCTAEQAGGNPHVESLYCADIDWAPDRLYQDGRLLEPSREPAEGWWVAQGGGTHTLIDTAHLTQGRDLWTGASVFFWDMDMTVQHPRPVTAFDPNRHELTLGREIWSDRVVQANKDLYFLQHSPQFLRRPGQWCLRKTDRGARVLLWPAGNKDPRQAVIEAPRRETVLGLGSCRHVAVRGLEVAHSLQTGIISRSPQARGLVIEGCHVHGHGLFGIWIDKCQGATVRGNLVRDNTNAVQIDGSSDVLVEHNEIGPDLQDGLRIAWGSDRVVARRNYIHDHNRWGHCDNIQMFKGATNITIEDNLLVHALQHIMASETSGGRIVGNVLLGSRAMQINIAPPAGKDLDYEIRGNTFFLGGWGLISANGENLRMHENLFVLGHGGFGLVLAKTARCVLDHNLHWQAPGLQRGPVAWGQHRPTSFEAYQKATGQDANGLYAEAKFRSAPAAFAKLDWRREHLFGRDRVYLWGGEGLFRPGDVVEIDFDGVPRRVRQVVGDMLTFEPAFPSQPDIVTVICNWKDRQNLVYDLGLAEDSPARKAGPGGGALGSRLDLAAFRRGDFDGDGRRDVPDLPKD